MTLGLPMASWDNCRLKNVGGLGLQKMKALNSAS